MQQFNRRLLHLQISRKENFILSNNINHNFHYIFILEMVNLANQYNWILKLIIIVLI